jgi:hypothetical protein
MDNFAEQLVFKKETKADKARRIGTVISGSLFTFCLVLIALMMLGKPMMAFFFFILAVGAGYGTYFLVTSSYVEYEYTFTNGELDVDKIIAKKKRTSLLSVEVRSFTDFGRYSDGLEESEDMTVVFATDNVASKEYYADFDHKEYGITRLVFVPDERMLDNIRKFLPAKLRNNIGD